MSGTNNNSVINMRRQIGAYGATYFDGTTVRTGKWFTFMPLTDTVFTTLTETNWEGGTHVGDTFPAGIPIYGNFTAITLASGSGIAYKSE